MITGLPKIEIEMLKGSELLEALSQIFKSISSDSSTSLEVQKEMLQRSKLLNAFSQRVQFIVHDESVPPIFNYRKMIEMNYLKSRERCLRDVNFWRLWQKWASPEPVINLHRNVKKSSVK